MKKFIFGLMLLVSMLGIVGCADPNNSDDPDGSENVVYTVKNDSESDMTISYQNKSGVYVNEKTIPVDGTYEITANDAKIDNIKVTDPFFCIESISSIIYLKIKVGDTELEGFIEVDPEKIANIIRVDTNESGKFVSVAYEQKTIEN